VNERQRFVEAWQRQEDTVAALCRRFGISRKTGYKWIRRSSEKDYAALEALHDRSRRPKTSPHAVEDWVVRALLGIRREHRTWGPKKTRAVLQAAYPRAKLPAVSTIAAIYKRHGLIHARRRRARTPAYTAPLGHAQAPNEVWCIDFKGHFPIGGRPCYPLTITDAYSRYILACIALRDTKTSTVRRCLEAVFAEYGLPNAIRSDNGVPFASKGVGGLTSLSAWWFKLGIRHERIEPGHPEQNGRHERMHRTLKAETASPPQRTRKAQQEVFDEFRHVFNHERPHEALNLTTPARHYDVSQRALPDPPWGDGFEYDERMEVARVSRLGRVHFSGGAFFLSVALRHDLVGVDWTRRGHWRVYFGPMLLGTVHRQKRTRAVLFRPSREIEAPTQKLLPMSVEQTVTHVAA
jgi:putative transposase